MHGVSVVCCSGCNYFQRIRNSHLNDSLNLAGMFPAGIIIKKEKVVKDV